MAEITVHQLKLGQYPEALRMMENEIAFTQFCCSARATADDGQTWRPIRVLELHPDTYVPVQRAAEELNRDGFFGYAGRQAERTAINLRNLPPDVIEKLISQQLSRILPPKPD